MPTRSRTNIVRPSAIRRSSCRGSGSGSSRSVPRRSDSVRQAGYGVGTWLINKPRQAAYVAGIKAVSCAVDAVEPLGEINIASLHASLTTLETGIPALQRGIAVLTPLVGDLENDLKQVDQTAF